MERATSRKPPCIAFPWSGRNDSGTTGLESIFVVQSLKDEVPRIARIIVVEDEFETAFMSIAFELDRQSDAMSEWRDDDEL